MKIIDVVKRSGRNLRQSKARTLLTSSAIAVGAFALCLTLAATNGAKDFSNKLIQSNFDPSELIVAKDSRLFSTSNPNSGTPIQFDETVGSSSGQDGLSQVKRLTDTDVADLKKEAGVESVREGYSVKLRYITKDDKKKYVGLADAYNPAQKPDLAAGNLASGIASGDALIADSFIGPLGFLSNQDAIGKTVKVNLSRAFDEATVAKLLAGSASQAVSDAKNLQVQNTKDFEFKIAGVTKKSTTTGASQTQGIIINNDDAKILNDFTTEGTSDYRKYSYVYVRVIGGTDKTKLKNVQDRLKQQGYTVQSVEDTQKLITKFITVLQGVVSSFGVIALIASAFGIINTMYISVLERTREIGLMKALGMRRKDISRLFRFEAGWIGFLGGVLGSILAFITSLALNPWLTKKLDLGDGQKLLIFNLPQVIILIIGLIILAIAAGLLPARKAAKLDPIEALRTE